MSLLRRYKSDFDGLMMHDHRNQFTITVFCKSLYLFLLFKLFFLRGILPEQLLSSPWISTDAMVNIFIIAMIVTLLSGILLRVNYISAFLIFVFSFSLSRSIQAVANGSDLVLNLFLFLSIFLCSTPPFKNPTLSEGQLVVRNFFFFFCKVQVTLIYLLSGFDKITSEAWRSGEAIFSIVNLDFFFNPLISISLSKTDCLLIAWVTILFELSFAFMIWIKKFRALLLLTGIVFHLAIAFLLSLPDFGLIMILLYSLFIPFEKPLSRPKRIAFDGN